MRKKKKKNLAWLVNGMEQGKEMQAVLLPDRYCRICRT